MSGPKLIKNQGTDISLGLETAFRATERGAEERDVPQGESSATRVMILISDGEDHEEQASSVAAKIKQSGARLYVLGIGTEKGGPIPLKDDLGNRQGFKRERSGEPIVSSFHPDDLMKIAGAANGRYLSVTADEAEVDELLQDMGALNRADYAEKKYVVYEERYQIPLIIAILLFLIEVSIPVRRIIGTIAILMTLPQYAHALDLSKIGTPLGAYLENEKGIQALQEGKASDAQKNFGAAQARAPSLPELEFNQGVSQYVQGDWDEAIQSFTNSAIIARDKNKSELQGKSLYNLGNALTKKGKLEEAVRAYADAIEVEHKLKNAALESSARKNLELVEKKIKEKKQEEQQKQEQSQKKPDQNGKEQGSKEGDQEKAQQSKEGQMQEQEKGTEQESKNAKAAGNYKNPQKQKFQSKTMSQDDAERVMSELANKERQLQMQDKIQENFKSKHVKSHATSKDW
jgi:Ca-activated chloride channel family protein